MNGHWRTKWVSGPLAVAMAMLVFPGVAPAQRTQRTVETSPVTFQLTSESCPRLPAGTTLNGTGSQTSVTWTTRHRRLRTITNSTNATGTATDQGGNQYTFVYSNQFRISNTRVRRNVYSGIMIDVFFLDGAGPATLRNGFLARYTTDFDDISRFRRITAFGDPIDFPTGAARCDPL
jgi:hypothetical protein